MYLHSFLTFTLPEDEWSASRPGGFRPGDRARGQSPRYPLESKQVRQCTCNVILRLFFRVTTVAVENSNYYIFWVFVCSLIYPGYKAQCTSLHCHLLSVWLYHIFSHYLKYVTIFEGEKVVEHKIKGLISVQFFLKHSLF